MICASSVLKEVPKASDCDTFATEGTLQLKHANYGILIKPMNHDLAHDMLMVYGLIAVGYGKPYELLPGLIHSVPGPLFSKEFRLNYSMQTQSLLVMLHSQDPEASIQGQLGKFGKPQQRKGATCGLYFEKREIQKYCQHEQVLPFNSSVC